MGFEFWLDGVKYDYASLKTVSISVDKHDLQHGDMFEHTVIKIERRSPFDAEKLASLQAQYELSVAGKKILEARLAAAELTAERRGKLLSEGLDINGALHDAINQQEKRIAALEADKERLTTIIKIAKEAVEKGWNPMWELETIQEPSGEGKVKHSKEECKDWNCPEHHYQPTPETPDGIWKDLGENGPTPPELIDRVLGEPETPEGKRLSDWKWIGTAKRLVQLPEISVEREVDVVELAEAEARLAVSQRTVDIYAESNNRQADNITVLQDNRVYLEGLLEKSVDRTAIAERAVNDLHARLAAAEYDAMTTKWVNEDAEDRIASLEAELKERGRLLKQSNDAGSRMLGNISELEVESERRGKIIKSARWCIKHGHKLNTPHLLTEEDWCEECAREKPSGDGNGDPHEGYKERPAPETPEGSVVDMGGVKRGVC